MEGKKVVEWVAQSEMKHSFTRALTARKVDFMMIITGERSKSGCRTAFLDDCKAAFSYGCPLRPSGIRIRVNGCVLRLS